MRYLPKCVPNRGVLTVFLVVFLFGAMLPALANAEPSSLHLNGPPGCQDSAPLTHTLTELLPRPWQSYGFALTINVAQSSQGGPGFSLQLSFHGAEGTVIERELVEADCTVLLEAAAMVVALTLNAEADGRRPVQRQIWPAEDDEPKGNEETAAASVGPSEAASDARAGGLVALGLNIGNQWGAIAFFDPFLQVLADTDVGPVRLRLFAAYGAGRSYSPAPGAAVSFQTVLTGGSLCAHGALGPAQAEGCVRGEVGRILVAQNGLSNADDGHEAWLGLGGTGALGLPLPGGMVLSVWGQGIRPLRRPRFTVMTGPTENQRAAVIYAVQPWVLRFGISTRVVF